MNDVRTKLTTIIEQDPTLSVEEKREVIEKLNNEEFYKKLIHGATGATIGLVVSKFFEMSKPAQALLTIAGYGIGKYLLDESRKYDKFLQYDERSGAYNIKT